MLNDPPVQAEWEIPMDEDDLPRSQSQPREATLAGSLGEVFGAMIWIVAIFALTAVVVRILVAWL